MKLYKAEVLFYRNDGGSWDTRFTFEKMDGEFKKIDDVEVLYPKGLVIGWVSDNKGELVRRQIPKTPLVNNTLDENGTMIAWQGFDRKLSKDEIQEVESQLSGAIRKSLALRKKH